MKHGLTGLCIAVLASLALAGTAWAQAISYENADNQNTTAVSGKTPMPVIATGGTQVTGTSGNVAAGSAVATLTATAATTAYITGFQCTGGGATAASIVNVTLAGVIGGTMTYNFAVPAGVTVGASPLIVVFDKAVAASAVNTNIVVTMPTLGAGNTNAACNAEGFLF